VKKYETPNYETEEVETSDIVTISSSYIDESVGADGTKSVNYTLSVNRFLM
jgi:hypothetical protein